MSGHRDLPSRDHPLGSDARAKRTPLPLFLTLMLLISAFNMGDRLLIGIVAEGSYKPWWREIVVTVHGWNGATVEGVKAYSDPATRTLDFTLPDQPRARTITVTR